MTKKAIITGATGMIGLALTKILIEKNYEVIAVARPESEKINNIPSDVRIIECDLNNLKSLTSLITEADMFFHMGWMNTMGSGRDNAENQLKNVEYTLDAVKLASELGCEVFVGAGSQAEYGLCSEKLTPDTPANPITAYGIAKYTAGKLSRILSHKLGMKHCWTRILSVYGPEDNNTLVMGCIKAILNDDEFNTTKADQIWDYLYSDDCAEALLDIAMKGHDGAVYTVGSGDAKPLKEYIETIRDMINPEFSIGFGNIDYYPNQVMCLHADISKLTRDTGFKPKVTFEEGIQKILDTLGGGGK